MAGLLNIISKLFGNKYDKDVKEITPIIEKINSEFSKLSTLTNDDLREKTSYTTGHTPTQCGRRIKERSKSGNNTN